MRFRRLRLFLKWCFAGLAGMVLLVLCSDWWLPSVLPTVLRQWDVQVASITRLEGGRWELGDVRDAVDGVWRFDSCAEPAALCAGVLAG
jgi:hypothetical protein